MPQPREHEALLALLEACARRPFCWRRHHCARFAARAVEAQTGRDPMAGLKVQSRRAALAVADELGGLITAVDARLARVAPALAQRGDIAGVPDELFGVRLMVVEGATLVGPGESGLRRLPRSAMMVAWSADVAEDD